jgi:MoaA/NifB/PqqE/SkfB family radical SAM enzyme
MNRCTFCAYHSDDARGGVSNVYNIPFKLRLDDFKRMVEICHEGRVPRVHICATGEPFLHSDILAMIDHMIEVCGYASVQTNFAQPLFTERGYLDEILRRRDFMVNITTDVLSGDPRVHEEMKRGSTYEDVLGAMEHLSARSDIPFEIHYIITKHNHRSICDLIDDLAKRRINCHLAIVNLHAYGFNEHTSRESLYLKRDTHITKALAEAKRHGVRRGIQVSIPQPADTVGNLCEAFWSRIQTWPVEGIETGRRGENVIIGACTAVVNGGLNSLGYFLDYSDIMQLWNNDIFIRIRESLLSGEYPDEACRMCMRHPDMHSEDLIPRGTEAASQRQS